MRHDALGGEAEVYLRPTCPRAVGDGTPSHRPRPCCIRPLASRSVAARHVSPAGRQPCAPMRHTRLATRHDPWRISAPRCSAYCNAARPRVQRSARCCNAGPHVATQSSTVATQWPCVATSHRIRCISPLRLIPHRRRDAATCHRRGRPVNSDASSTTSGRDSHVAWLPCDVLKQVARRQFPR